MSAQWEMYSWFRDLHIANFRKLWRECGFQKKRPIKLPAPAVEVSPSSSGNARRRTMWTLTAPVDAFQLLAHRLTSANLARFKDAFRKVFGRIDSKVEIPPEKWIFHSQRLEG